MFTLPVLDSIDTAAIILAIFSSSFFLFRVKATKERDEKGKFMEIFNAQCKRACVLYPVCTIYYTTCISARIAKYINIQ